jgi:hypothetical protein
MTLGYLAWRQPFAEDLSDVLQLLNEGGDALMTPSGLASGRKYHDAWIWTLTSHSMRILATNEQTSNDGNLHDGSGASRLQANRGLLTGSEALQLREYNKQNLLPYLNPSLRKSYALGTPSTKLVNLKTLRFTSEDASGNGQLLQHLRLMKSSLYLHRSRNDLVYDDRLPMPRPNLSAVENRRLPPNNAQQTSQPFSPRYYER